MIFCILFGPRYGNVDLSYTFNEIPVSTLSLFRLHNNQTVDKKVLLNIKLGAESHFLCVL